MLKLDAVRQYIFRPELYRKYNVAKFMTEAKAVIVVTDTMGVVTRKFEKTHEWNLPVIRNDGTYIGFISRSGLFNTYRRTLVNFTSD